MTLFQPHFIFFRLMFSFRFLSRITITVQKWCKENGVNIKTYYYHLRKVRNQFIESAPSIVPLTIPETKSDIIIEKNDIKISLPSDVSAEILVAVIREIC